MVEHAARKHATWSASATERNWQCAGALALTHDLPETTNRHADWGTCAHEIAEICLRENRHADDFIGTVRRGKEFEFEVDEEMAETAQIFIDYCRERETEAELLIEQSFSLDAISTPMDAGGTADVVLLYYFQPLLEVVDLKGGKGIVVEVRNNKQLRMYALGAILAKPSLRTERVKLTVVQPRAYHEDGPIRSETITVIELLEWANDLSVAMHKAAEAMRWRANGEMDADRWNQLYLKAGDHCKFCKAAGSCPALEKKALSTASAWFDDLGQLKGLEPPNAFTPERAAQILDAAEMISDWISAIRSYWHEQAETGVDIPGYTLVESKKRKKWNVDVEIEVAGIARKAGLSTDKIYNSPKLRTPKQIEDELSKIDASSAITKMSRLYSRPPAGTNLVKLSKTSRTAVAPIAHQYFDVLE